MNASRKQIYQYLLERIARGHYAVDDRIPTEEELGTMFSAHRMDAHYAVKELEEHGVLRRRRKHGTFVSRIPGAFMMGELKSLTTRRVCVLNTTPPEYQHIHWNQRLIKPLEDGLREAEIDIQFENVSALKTVEEYRDFLTDQIARGMNALLLVPRNNDESSPISRNPELLFEFHNNVFVFDRGVHDWNSWPYSTMSINVFGEGVMVAEHLMTRGIKNAVFCHHGSIASAWLTERMNGFRFGLCRQDQAMQEMKLGSNPPGRAFLNEIKRLIDRGPTALVAQNDEFAVTLINTLREAGLEAGKDIAVIGFDDNSLYSNYNLTTVSPSLERIGHQLAALIRGSLDAQEPRDVTCTRVNSELIVRSTG